MRTVLTVGDDGVIILPEEFLKELEWKEGTVLEWIDNEDGSFELRKIND